MCVCACVCVRVCVHVKERSTHVNVEVLFDNQVTYTGINITPGNFPTTQDQNQRAHYHSGSYYEWLQDYGWRRVCTSTHKCTLRLPASMRNTPLGALACSKWHVPTKMHVEVPLYHEPAHICQLCAHACDCTYLSLLCTYSIFTFVRVCNFGLKHQSTKQQRMIIRTSYTYGFQWRSFSFNRCELVHTCCITSIK